MFYRESDTRSHPTSVVRSFFFFSFFSVFTYPPTGKLTAYSIVTNHGLGKHIWDIRVITLTPDLAHVRTFPLTPEPQNVSFQKPTKPLLTRGPFVHLQVFGSVGLTYGVVIFLVKLSVLLLLFNLFGVHPKMRYFIYLGIGFQAVCSAVYSGYDLAVLVKCVDAASLQNSVCVNTWIMTIFIASVNVSTDVYILVLPIVMVLRLQLTRHRKIGVISIFLVGLL